MKRLRLRLEADLEFLEATLWYETEREGLGFEFDEEVHATLGRVAQSPKHFPVIDGEVRRAVIDRFPLRSVLCRIRRRDLGDRNHAPAPRSARVAFALMRARLLSRVRKPRDADQLIPAAIADVQIAAHGLEPTEPGQVGGGRRRHLPAPRDRQVATPFAWTWCARESAEKRRRGRCS